MNSLAGARSIWKHMSILLDLCWVFPRLSQLVFLVSLPIHALLVYDTPCFSLTVFDC